jgi:hypothetical protein
VITLWRRVYIFRTIFRVFVGLEFFRLIHIMDSFFLEREFGDACKFIVYSYNRINVYSLL